MLARVCSVPQVWVSDEGNDWDQRNPKYENLKTVSVDSKEVRIVCTDTSRLCTASKWCLLDFYLPC